MATNDKAQDKTTDDVEAVESNKQSVTEKFHTLANELEAERFQKEDQPNDQYRYLNISQSKIDEVISNLRDDSYSDFRSKFATPKVRMAQDFEAINRKDVAKRVRKGEFDD